MNPMLTDSHFQRRCVHLGAGVSLLGLLACASEPAPPPAPSQGGDAGTALDSASALDASLATDATMPRDSGAPVVRGPLDYAGRAYFEAALVTDSDRVAYNTAASKAAASVPAVPPPVAPSVSTRLHAIDLVDGTQDWPLGDGGAHPLASYAAFDVLLLDPNLPFSRTSFLDIETRANAHQTCGGRWFDDNAQNKAASMLVSAGRTAVNLTQTATVPTATLSFPYLLPSL